MPPVQIAYGLRLYDLAAIVAAEFLAGAVGECLTDSHEENQTMRKSAVATMIASLLCASPALAWNGFGHMTVAAVA